MFHVRGGLAAELHPTPIILARARGTATRTGVLDAGLEPLAPPHTHHRRGFATPTSTLVFANLRATQTTLDFRPVGSTITFACSTITCEGRDVVFATGELL